MKVQKIFANRFAKDEYAGFDKPNIDGEDLLITGGNRTGKTLTFNAILYNLLGPRHTIDLSTGRQNDVRIVYDDGTDFRRGQPEAEFRNGETLTGDDAQEKLAEILCHPASDDVDSPSIIKNHFLHSHIESMPLSRLGKDDRLNHIRAVVDAETQEEIEETEDRVEELETQITVDRESLRRAKEDRDELQNELRSARNQLEKYERINDLIESGELDDIINLLNAEEGIKERISEISREQEHLRQEKRSLRKQRRQWERYRRVERHTLIAQAVNDFVCPACGDRVDTELAESRLSNSRCPFCAVEERADDLETDVEEKMDVAEGEIEEVVSALDEVNSRLDELEEEMVDLREARPELEQIDGPIETVIRSNDYEIQEIVSDAETESERYRSKVDEAENKLERVQTEISSLEESIDANEDDLENSKEQLRNQIEASIAAEIGEFSERWEEIFQSMAGELGLEIQIDGHGEIEIPGNDGPRNYDSAGDLSDAEVTFLNISFAITFNRYARESEITSWETIVCDEPFSNLDKDGEESLLEFISEAEEQFICTSSDTDIEAHFPKTGELVRGQIQTQLERYF